MRYWRDKFKTQPALAIYFANSVIVTGLDISIVWTLTRLFAVNLVLANTIGVVAGFLVHYALSSKSVFDTDYGTKGFIIYLTTFIFGLFLANWLIYVSYEFVFTAYLQDIRLLLSKAVSTLVPFFALYFVRKYLYSQLKNTSLR